MEMLVLGSAVVDILASPVPAEKDWQEKQRISSISLSPGGDALNQSLHLSDLGVETGLAACLGDDGNARFLLRSLEERGVSTDFIRLLPDASTGTALVLISGDGTRHVFSSGGAHSLLSKETLPKLPEGLRAISLASLFQFPRLEDDGLLPLLRQCRERGVLVFADLAADKRGLGLAGIEPFLPWIDWFLPSLYDICSLTGTQTAGAAASVLREKGARGVVIKCGEEGCLLSFGNVCRMVPAIPVSCVDTTGAGDCLVSVFAAEMINGASPEEALAFACAAASLNTLYTGASSEVLTRERILAFQGDHSF